jgi:moderate conductance mechanosensitive channel
MDLGVAYKEDTDKVCDVVKEVAAGMQADAAFASYILAPVEILGVDDFGDSAVVIKLRMKTIPIQQWAVGREFRRRLKYAFDAKGIEIPFPHQTLYFGEASKPFQLDIKAPEQGAAAARPS